MTATNRWSLIGVPTSAGAFVPGQERAPAALRAAGLVERLTAAGLDVVDTGDSPVWRWRPDRANRSAQNLDAVAAQASATADRVADAVAAGSRTLVLGGDCTLALGVVSGHLRATDRRSPAGRLGLIYLDMHPDLNIPTSVPDGALDWMGMAHLLGEPGTLPELSEVGPRSPMLSSGDVVFLGYDRTQMSAHEQTRFDAIGLYGIPVADVRAHPAAAAGDALERLAELVDRILIHFDVDVIDFIDAPLSENDGRNVGLTLDQAFEALAALCEHSKLAGITITELNPDHGAEDGSDLARFVEGLALVLAGSQPLWGGAVR